MPTSLQQVLGCMGFGFRVFEAYGRVMGLGFIMGFLLLWTRACGV